MSSTRMLPIEVLTSHKYALQSVHNFTSEIIRTLLFSYMYHTGGMVEFLAGGFSLFLYTVGKRKRQWL